MSGACVVALGSHAAGLFSNNDRLAESLLGAGEFSHDRAWRLPMWDEYAEALKSNFADVANVGGREGGAITAASFLSRFATGVAARTKAPRAGRCACCRSSCWTGPGANA
jgi:leucyl aminopeptidase